MEPMGFGNISVETVFSGLGCSHFKKILYRWYTAHHSAKLPAFLLSFSLRSGDSMYNEIVRTLDGCISNACTVTQPGPASVLRSKTTAGNSVHCIVFNDFTAEYRIAYYPVQHFVEANQF